MAPTQSPQGPSDPDATGSNIPDAPEMWGNGGLVGDGRYRLTHRLGRGGMAEVFAAEDVRLGRTVAVKLLRADLAEDPVSKARFTREAQSVAGLNHHAVVAVYDSGEDYAGGKTVPYIVMELVEGRTIRDLLLNADAPPPDQALIIVSGVLEALAYSHQHGIVHRDIKPANVIITNSGAVKVMDFGIARALHGAASTMTQTGMVMGTPQYLSPEQALGKTVDTRSDLYATGCLLYELLALRPPFTGETPLSVVYQHVQDMPVPPSQVLDSVPPELDGLVMRSLAKDPDDRFQTAEEMRGLVQYALQMLQDQGGHSGGVWNTGPVAVHEGGHGATRSMAATTALPHPDHGQTAAQPMLPPNMVDRNGGGYDGSHGGPARSGGRGKIVLVVVLAVIAVAIGVAFAVRQAGSGTETPKKEKKTTAPPTTPEKSAEPSTPPPTTEQQTQPGGTGGNSGTYTHRPTYRPTWRPTTQPSTTPPPTHKPSSPPPTTSGDGGNTSQGNTSQGTTDGGNGDNAGNTSTGQSGSSGNTNKGTDNGGPAGDTTDGSGVTG
ncbi:protein kinase [Streptomyces sp. MST-110588]|uniref:protein kinase domain-containing protein n=1 Tax=Streptomyces sp. MST-110588 TaxID=2833628 RepID=UPI001F5CE8A8|nr:protein kinase [Streptomyces sp. MST-110588]UNO41022.1 protein kinase [Streptomyces sp. MST-110588]